MVASAAKDPVQDLPVGTGISETPLGMLEAPTLKSIDLALLHKTAATLDPCCSEMLQRFVKPFSGMRRVLARAGVLAILAPMPWSFAASAQDPATMSLSDLTAQASDLAPVGLYTLAGQLFATGRRDEAVVWFYIAQIRSRFRLAAAPDLPPDGEPALYAALNDTLGREINGWAFGDVDRVAAQISQALDWDRTHANAFTSKSAHATALEQIRSGLVALRASVLAQKDDIRRKRVANGLVNR